jgi:hypothetical protein
MKKTKLSKNKAKNRNNTEKYYDNNIKKIEVFIKYIIKEIDIEMIILVLIIVNLIVDELCV